MSTEIKTNETATIQGQGDDARLQAVKAIWREVWGPTGLTGPESTDGRLILFAARLAAVAHAAQQHSERRMMRRMEVRIFAAFVAGAICAVVGRWL
jgi:hypothetical protein